ncbi:MAG: NYN domain-containing protein [Bacteroidetes bacterium]|uniref:NYN domain-containing protein n=1 Tax=Flavobacterium sp. TaxID=239 RepID=UPI002FD9DBCC|nr:NYN domain-containing protein [Bacteroidota bacterium]
MIDGGFFIQRFKFLNKRKNPTRNDLENLIKDVIDKVKAKSGNSSIDILYRTYYYDCLPFDKQIKDINKKTIDFKKTPIYQQQIEFIESLKSIDQFALRLGVLSFAGWKLNVYKPENPPSPDFKQKGVDIKIGLDMAWMAGKNVVGKIVLVAGDSDFISPIKFVRREGILVYVYPMENNLNPSLIEHCDFVLS